MEITNTLHDEQINVSEDYSVRRQDGTWCKLIYFYCLIVIIMCVQKLENLLFNCLAA